MAIDGSGWFPVSDKFVETPRVAAKCAASGWVVELRLEITRQEAKLALAVTASALAFRAG
jgi:hypothetical protein